jgi:PPOX class probable F420-dependent enzyme
LLRREADAARGTRCFGPGLEDGPWAALGALHGPDPARGRFVNCVQNHVWFIWDDGSFVIFSQPNQAKLNNIRRTGRVSFNLESIDEETITIFTGHAEIVPHESIPQSLLDRYAQRYAEGLKNLKMTREEYEAAYTAPIRFTPEKVRGW